MNQEERKKRGLAAREQYKNVVPADHLPDNIRVGDQWLFSDDHPVRYGLSPGTAAKLFYQKEYNGPSVPNAEIVQAGKIRSYGNIEDWDTGLNLLIDLARRFPEQEYAASMKHGIPFAVGKADTLERAYDLAWNADPIIPFGSVLAFSGEIDENLAEQIAGTFVDGVLSTGYTDKAKEILAQKRDLRLISVPNFEYMKDRGYEVKNIRGGLLVAERHVSPTLTCDDIVVRTEQEATTSMLEAALFQWTVLQYIRSNAAVFGDDEVTYGVGSGQGSRVDAIETAFKITARRNPYFKRWKRGKKNKRKGLVLATDGFPPETDSIEACAEYGVQGFMSPIGSQKDRKVYERAVDLGLTMMTTKSNERPFTHR